MITLMGREWLAVTIGTARPSNGRSRPVAWQLRDARTGAHLGELWRDTNRQFTARREGTGVRLAGHRTRGHALASAGLLATVRADLAAGDRPTRVIVPDGPVATVHAVTPVDGTREVTLHTTVHGEAWQFTVRASTLLPLAPPCTACTANAGEACAVGCPFDA